MIFATVCIVLVGAIAYFHYVQGFFSATLSAILAILSAAVALSYQETLVRAMLRGKVADQANALVLVALFALTYTVLRAIFDKFVPGNLRLPVLLDKIGAGVAGAVAGVFAVGIFAIAAQMLPLGPSIAGYARYDLAAQQSVQLPTQRQAMDTYVYDVLKSDTLASQNHSTLLLPVDDIVVNLTAHLSGNGSLAGTNDLSAAHPSYLDELFAQRLGIQTGAKHVAYNLESDQQVTLRGVYTLDSVPQAPGEIEQIRKSENLRPLVSTATDILLVTRLSLSNNASDSDNNVRISPASVRLVAAGNNYIPLGTLDQTGGGLFVRENRPDDFLIVPGDGTVDFVFQVPRNDVGTPLDPRNKLAPLQIGPGVFLEAKRLAYVDLSGQQVQREIPAPAGATVLRKKALPGPKSVASAGAAVRAAVNAPFEMDHLLISPQLFTDINVGAHESDSQDVVFGSGSATLQEKKFIRLQVDPTQTLRLLQQGDFLIRDFWVPPGQKLVQAIGSPPSVTANAWEWADKLSQFELIDANGVSFKPHGAWTKIKQGTSDRLVVRYNAQSLVNDLPGSEGRPTDVGILFIVPDNTALRELRFAGKRLKVLNQQVQ